MRALTILEAAGHAARLAGGCVRDRLLGVVPKDFDVASSATPAQVIAVFRAANVKTVPTGVEHGTVTLVMPSGPIEVTTLRRDVATDGRYASVSFDASFQEDAGRRDFTINAMFEDRDGRIHDFFGGREDLKARVLRFVGDAEQRIVEDYLRSMRFFRFWARLGFTPDPAALAAIAKTANGLMRVSQERITSELKQILASPAPLPVLRSMVETGVAALVAPEIVFTPCVLPEVGGKLRWLAVLAALSISSPGPRVDAQALGERWKLSRLETRMLAEALAGQARLPVAPVDRAEAMARIDAAEAAGGEGSFFAFYLPVWHAASRGNAAAAAGAVQLAQVEAQHGALRRTRPPITGEDLQKELGMAPGPALGATLDFLLKSFRNGDWKTRAEGLALGSRFLPG